MENAGQIRPFINNVSWNDIWLGVNGQCQLDTIMGQTMQKLKQNETLNVR